MRILMVCLGNICRSPLAEGILQHKANAAGLNWTVESAGTLPYHVGEAPHQFSQDVAACRGIDITKQVARLFKPEDVNNYDIIYAMAKDVLQNIKDLSSSPLNPDSVKLFLDEQYPGENKDVPDPWYSKNVENFHAVFDIIDETCNIIINKYSVKANG